MDSWLFYNDPSRVLTGKPKIEAVQLPVIRVDEVEFTGRE
jgi:hypothetical protein